MMKRLILSFFLLATAAHAERASAAWLRLPRSHIVRIPPVTCGYVSGRWEPGSVRRKNLFLTTAGLIQNLYGRLRRTPPSGRSELRREIRAARRGLEAARRICRRRRAPRGAIPPTPVPTVTPGAPPAPTPGSTPTQTPTAPAPPPGSPREVHAVAVSDREIALSWERNDSYETALRIWRAEGQDGFQELAALPARSNIFTDPYGRPATSYRYYVSAENASGSSGPSNEVQAVTKASGATLQAAVNLTASALSHHTVQISWEEPGSQSASWHLERSYDGLSWNRVDVLDRSEGPAFLTRDTQIPPGTLIRYRVWPDYWAYGDFAETSVTTPARPSGVPVDPAALGANVLSATQVVLSWTDTNAGSASYVIETAPFNWTENDQNWSEQGETAPGATTHALTTSAETFFYVRIRARKGSLYSGYTDKVRVRTASAGTGTSKQYEIGPGKAHQNLAALDWSLLGPGDRVLIYPNRNGDGEIVPYFEKPLISSRGTADASIDITGVADPATGRLPIIDGTGAVTHSQWRRNYMPMGDLSLILVAPRHTSTSGGWSPGYLKIRNLELRGAYRGDPDTTARTYTAWDGSVREYTSPSAIYLEKGDHITISGCIIHDNAQGIFGAGQGDQRNLEDISIESNRIYGNGIIDNYLVHNSYLEGINLTYQFNKYEPLRAGATGGGLKDRSAGVVIRYNYLEGGGHLIDLVETQNYYSTVSLLPSYRRSLVYGNIFYNHTATTPVHYGGDQLYPPGYRKGVLHFHHNTFVTHLDRSTYWRWVLLALKSGGERADARNNVVVNHPRHTSTPPEFNLVNPDSVAFFGRTWASTNWNSSRPDQPFTGLFSGSSNITGTGAEPGFTNFSAQDFRPAPGSQALDLAEDLPGDMPPITQQYVEPASGRDRPVIGTAMDLGAFEFE